MVAESTTRPYSTVHREVVGGQSVYVKQCRPGSRYDTDELVRAQVGREAELLTAIAELPGVDGSRLGVVGLHSVDLATSTISTFEVPGQLLDGVLADIHTAHGATRALLLAGRWLRHAQDASVTTEFPVPDNNPLDLVEHCRIRLDILQELGQTWVTDALVQRITQRVSDLVEAADADDRRRVICHGDFGPYNLIWDGRTLTPIDFAAATMDVPLADLTYLIHRLEMLAISKPLRRLPIELWRRACLRGYGLDDTHQSPMYDALMIRWLLSRLKKLTQRQSDSWIRRRRDDYLNRTVRRRLLNLVTREDAS